MTDKAEESTIQIRRIVWNTEEYRAALRLRDEVLRRPIGMRIEDDPIEQEWADEHIGAFVNGELIGVVTLTKKPGGTVQMRQLAVAEARRRSGVGQQLVLAAERRGKEDGFCQVSFHARESARPFYEKLGYNVSGEAFQQIGIPHLRMSKAILKRARGTFQDREIGLIALDLDGTVLDERKKISKRNRKAIERAIARGVLVIPATGRPRVGLPEELTSLPGIQYALTSNGAAVVDLLRDEVVYSDLLENSEILKIFDLVLPFDELTEVYMDGQCYTEKRKLDESVKYARTKVMAEYSLRIKTPVPSIRDFVEECGKPAEKIHILLKHPERRAEIMTLLEQVPGIVLTSSIDNNIEINKSTANKGIALLKLAAYLGLKRRQLMAVGDSDNDTDMIRAAGLSVVMENGEEALKALADYVTRDNESDGVAYAIERLLKAQDQKK